MSNYSATEQDAIRRDNRAMEAAGISMVDELDAIKDDITEGAIGITALAADVDAVCLDGYTFGQDTDTTTGLTFGYKAGRFHNGLAIVSVSAGTVLLTASQTNYVEVHRAGTVSANISGFTSGSLPLYVVVTGAGTITSVTNRKPVLQLIGTAGVVGAMLSTAGKTKSTQVYRGTLSATDANSVLILPNVAGTITAIRVQVSTTVAANDTNYWTFSAQNRGAAGSGTTALLAAADANTTKATGGSGLTAYVARSLTLHGTGANLVTAANDVVLFTATKTASGDNLVNFVVEVDITFEA